MARQVYLWLVPGDADATGKKLAQVIEASGSPKFAPHVTLAIFDVLFSLKYLSSSLNQTLSCARRLRNREIAPGKFKRILPVLFLLSFFSLASFNVIIPFYRSIFTLIRIFCGSSCLRKGAIGGENSEFLLFFPFLIALVSLTIFLRFLF